MRFSRLKLVGEIAFRREKRVKYFLYMIFLVLYLTLKFPNESYRCSNATSLELPSIIPSFRGVYFAT